MALMQNKKPKVPSAIAPEHAMPSLFFLDATSIETASPDPMYE